MTDPKPQTALRNLRSLLLACAWVVNAGYWHNLTGSWLDHHITDHELAPMFCLAGVFFFTRVLGKLFNI